MYKQSLVESLLFKARFYNITIKANLLHTTEITKVALSSLDTKR